MAVLRQRHDMVEALLAMGFPVALPNARKWLPIDEAIAMNGKRMVRLITEFRRNALQDMPTSPFAARQVPASHIRPCYWPDYFVQ